jgi:hypothetical protein
MPTVGLSISALHDSRELRFRDMMLEMHEHDFAKRAIASPMCSYRHASDNEMIARNRAYTTIDYTAFRQLGFGLSGAPSIGMQSFLGIVTCVDKTQVDLPLCAKSLS